MATMVPDRFDEATSTAERRVFERLRVDPDTRGWSALHSLALSRRGRRPYGEIDFVVLVPDLGIVCVEVKGGRVSCRDGVWRTKDHLGHETDLTRSPFQQAREGMFALRTALQSQFGQTDVAGRALLASAVVFPDVESPPSTTEFEPWEAIDIVRLRQPISKLLRDVLRHQREKFGPGPASPDAETLRRVRNFLRPDFDVVIARSTTIARSEERLLQLTEEQYEAIDSLERNERCVVEGAAGTGKTMLALEYARRSVAAGRNTLLLCFNRMLGAWISDQASTISGAGSLTAGSYHRLLRDRILTSPLRSEFLGREASEPAGQLFSQVYPLYGELALAESQELPDVVVVDEAQDLATDSELAVLNAWTRGGLAGGTWAMFGDFARQAIYSRSETGADAAGDEPATQFRERLRRFAPHHATIVLRRNCRNTRPIGEETALLSGFESLPYRLDSGDSLSVDYRWWRSADVQADILRAVLSSLKGDGIRPGDVLVLSPSRFENSVASRLVDDPNTPVAPVEAAKQLRVRGPAAVAFSTVHAFKGMESSVVLLCDIDRMSGPEAEAILYVGMSRARSHLVILLNERLRPEIQMAVRRRLTTGWSS